MYISRDLTINVQGDNAVLDEPLYLFQNDKNIDIYFTIINFKFDFLTATQRAVNVVSSSYAEYAKIKILKPNSNLYTNDELEEYDDGIEEHGYKLMSKEIPIVDGKVVFTINDTLMDEVREIGEYKLQIILYDGMGGRITIPHITFEVLKPIFSDDLSEDDYVIGQIDITHIGKSLIAPDSKEMVELKNRYGEAIALEFTDHGLWTWTYGDVIKASYMNKINEQIEALWNNFKDIQLSIATDASSVSYNEKYPTVRDALDYLTYEPIKIESLSTRFSDTAGIQNGTTVFEIGKRIGCSLVWTYNGNAEIEQQTINNQAIDINLRSHALSLVTSDTVYTLAVKDTRGTIVSKNISLVFQNRVYWGVSTIPSTYNDFFFRVTLQNNALSGNVNRTFTVEANENEYIYYAVPARMKNCVFTVGGFEGGFETVGTFYIGNSSAYSEDYVLYKSIRENLGNTTIVVT